ncbi:hypothetical protein [uncultured Mameliella sp.]|uniref:dCTP deaminase domain-containing protein n=1 Tax=uncultured Mameliella sp. TaxID=1447087 RepID=UPI002603FE2F|nr:hypothetical protein [uncultured Mameliella sp.]
MTFWGRNEWLSTSDCDFPVEPRDHSKVEEAGYKLSVGDQIYLTEKNGAKVRNLAPGETFFISPGQFAYILTEERVKIPLDMIGFISVRASIKFYGLVNVSGFHVDPGYKGKLIFAVFNSGPSRINLQRGQSIFSLWVASLASPISTKDAPKKSYDELSPDVINKIDGQHLTAYQVHDNIEDVRKIAEENKDDLRKIKLYFWLAVLVLGIIVFPIARHQVTQAWKSGVAQDFLEGVDPATRQPTNP